MPPIFFGLGSVWLNHRFNPSKEMTAVPPDYWNGTTNAPDSFNPSKEMTAVPPLPWKVLSGLT